MGIVSLSQQKRRLQIGEFEVDNSVVFEYFNRLSSADRDSKLLQALYIGVLAMMEDRISSFLAKTSNELGTELESLKMIFEMKQELFFKSSVKGVIAEEEIAEYLIGYAKENKLNDDIFLTGNATGSIPRNKTGDIVCRINGRDDLRIVIECKFDKNIRIGDIRDKEVFSNRTDTAWSQLIEAQANRDGKVGILVMDLASVDGVLLREIQTVRYIPEIGFVAIVDSQKGDYSNLAIAYMLSRDLAVNAKDVDLSKDLLSVLVNRIIKDISDAVAVKKLITANIDNNKKILEQLNKSLLSMEFSKKFLLKFLSTGNLKKSDLLEFYFGDEIKEEFKAIESEIANL